ncbi:hypothetical protein [Glycocaulis alkaliphilus]|nr:hypothetical protein [Glycocaulis alkaliphilus]
MAGLLAAQRQWELGGNPSWSGPLYQFHAAARVEAERGAFEAGDNIAILAALRICCAHEMPAPEWLSLAFITRYDKLLTRREKSLDDVFGPVIGKGKQLHSLRMRREKALAVYLEIRRRSEDGDPIGEALFAAVGEKFAVSASVAERWYYEAKNEHAKLATALSSENHETPGNT